MPNLRSRLHGRWHRRHEQFCIQPCVTPLQAPVEVGSGSPARGTDAADELSLPDHITNGDLQGGAMQECTVQAHAVIQHQQAPLQAERRLRRQHHHAVRRGDKGRATGPRRNVRARVIAAGGTVIDPLRAKAA